MYMKPSGVTCTQVRTFVSDDLVFSAETLSDDTTAFYDCDIAAAGGDDDYIACHYLFTFPKHLVEADLKPIVAVYLRGERKGARAALLFTPITDALMKIAEKVEGT
jgi:hypothetical protein